MNTPVSIAVPTPKRGWSKWGVALLLLAILVPLLVVMGVTSYFRMGRDARALRNSFLESKAGAFQKKIELSVGGLTCGLARAGLSFVNLKPEARSALSALRSGEVGVYQVARDFSGPDRMLALTSADEAMTRRGWDRLVGVMHRREMVAVYVPREGCSERDTRFCLAVLDGHQLVVVSARGNLEPLLALASSRPEWKQKMQLAMGQ